MSSKTRLILTLTIISITLGFMMAVQYKHTQTVNEQVSWNVSNRDVLEAKEKLVAIQKQNKELENHLNELNKQILALEQEASKYDTSDIQNSLEKARILAGTSPVKGPGIVLTIDDSKRGSKSSDPVTHDTDVMRLVNEIFLSGAEAVSVNGERIGSVTGIMCVGPTVRINDRLLTPPYKIEAIGDPSTLIKGLTMQGGMLDELRSMDRLLQIQGPKEVDLIRMKGYSGDPEKLSSNPARQ
ncbi:DUF881 domain-containing protein [Effusibacillus lacus]|uniref:DUF881 domain-containing protein n=1 Tax=Effusibacillus lacus TaxID=1348429 RepID=A0A292YE37_9BACL|nr:DUF881 domain-containing protein [Effusibacillus lacus]TCS75681.1 uncharacterized protein YlxW (UPF0749 family) [Effusibacillus lacus]GAX91002.1 hypothetical protein EFBL_2662 [Effusibacillus lacus]